jgi:acetate---CoA ligase (ADP-forming)
LSPDTPLSRSEALNMVKSLKTWPLLDGYRGRPRADVEAFLSAIVGFSEMAARLGEHIVEAEIDPVFVLPGGLGIRAADDMTVILKPKN